MSPGGTERLVDAIQALSMARDIDRIAEVVRHAARDMTGADGATFILRDHDQCYYVDEDAIAPLWSGMRFPMETCVSGWAMLNKQAAIIPDIYSDDRVPHEAYRPTFVHSMAMVPIREVEPIGAIGNYWSAHHSPTEAEVGLLQALANATSIVMENVSVRDELVNLSTQAFTDDLTGLLNRRGFASAASDCLHQAHESGAHAVIAYLDLDGLKAVNDANGHAAGDVLIKEAAAALRQVVRAEDPVARLGGDEFSLITVGQRDGGDELRSRLTSALAERAIAASIGIIDIPPESDATILQLIEQVDTLMYTEKTTKAAAGR